MKWYYSKNNTQLGPVEESELQAKLATGEVTPADLVWREGMGDWLPAGNVPELARPAATSLDRPAAGNPPPSPYAPPANRDFAPVAVHGVPIPTYLWQSIVVTILCCLPLGIPAIVYAARVESLRLRGDIAGAMAASSSAKMWCLIALIAGLVFNAIVGVFAFVGAAAAPHPGGF